MTNWYIGNTRKEIIVWNYKDSTGYQHSPLTYSRNVYNNLYDDPSTKIIKNYDIDGETVGRIELTTAWQGDTIPKGTSVGQIYPSGGTKYPIKNGGHYTEEWKEYAGTIDGIGTENTKFNYAAKYIQLYEMPNYASSAGSSGVTNYYKDIYVREMVE